MIMLFAPLVLVYLLRSVSTAEYGEANVRSLQGQPLPARVVHAASHLNSRIYNGALATQELVKRFNDMQHPIAVRDEESLVGEYTQYSRSSTNDPVHSESSGHLNKIIGAGVDAVLSMIGSGQSSSEDNGTASLNNKHFRFGNVLERAVHHLGTQQSFGLFQPRLVLSGGPATTQAAMATTHIDNAVDAEAEHSLGLPPGALAHSLGNPLLSMADQVLAEEESSNSSVDTSRQQVANNEEMIKPKIAKLKPSAEVDALGLQSTSDPSVEVKTHTSEVVIELDDIPTPPQVNNKFQEQDCFIQATALLATNPLVKADISTPILCQRECIRHRDCLAFTFFSASQKCMLFDVVLSLKMDSAAISGPRICAADDDDDDDNDDNDGFDSPEETEKDTGTMISVPEPPTPATSSVDDSTMGVADNMRESDSQNDHRRLAEREVERYFPNGDSTGHVSFAASDEQPVHTSYTNPSNTAEGQSRIEGMRETVATSVHTRVPIPTTITEEACLAGNTAIQGEKYRKIDEIDSPKICQALCASLPTCQYFSYTLDTKICQVYDSADAVFDASNTVSGLRSCTSDTPQYRPNGKSSLGLYGSGGLSLGPIVGPDAVHDMSAPGDDNEPFYNTYPALAPEYYPAEVKEDGGGRGFLGGLVSTLLGEQVSEVNEMEGLAAGATNALTSLKALVAAGQTVMNTFPIKDFVKAGYQLSNSGLFDKSGGAKGGVGIAARNKAAASAPPSGVSSPEVKCLTEGMKCCVPRNAAPKYQIDPPKLNGVDSSRCRAKYVSASDQLCVTTRYTDEECEANILETETRFVYRNIMVMPGRTMNDAICECSILKEREEGAEEEQDEDSNSNSSPAISGSAKWQYSLAAQVEAEETKLKTEEQKKKLTKVSDIAKMFGEAFTNSIGGGGGGSDFEPSDLFNSVFEIARKLKQEKEREGPNQKRRMAQEVPEAETPQAAGSNINATIRRLQDHLDDFRKAENKKAWTAVHHEAEQQRKTSDRFVGTNLQRQLRSIGESEGESNNDSTSPTEDEVSYALPYGCSIWPKSCETSLEGLLFNESCRPLKVVHRGCVREDLKMSVDVEANPQKPQYSFQIPGVYNNVPVDMACDFIYKNASHPKSLCSSGVKFPIPDQGLPEDWPAIRERGPLLFELLYLLSFSLDQITFPAPTDKELHQESRLADDNYIIAQMRRRLFAPTVDPVEWTMSPLDIIGTPVTVSLGNFGRNDDPNVFGLSAIFEIDISEQLGNHRYGKMVKYEFPESVVTS